MKSLADFRYMEEDTDTATHITGTGLALSRRFFHEEALPDLQMKYPDLVPLIAAGCFGDGSDCLGYDDEISQDHDFGPGFYVWVSDDVMSIHGETLRDWYRSLPGSFEGYETRLDPALCAERAGVLTIGAFFQRYTGLTHAPENLREWLMIPEDKLAALTSGELFFDGPNEFSAVMDRYLQYYPEDLRRKKIAARLAFIGQSGQYNYARCMRRGDIVAAEIALAIFVRECMTVFHLLDRKYAPYYKWTFRSLSELPGRANTSETLRKLIAAGEQSHAWTEGFDKKWMYTLNLADQRVVLIEEIAEEIVEELKTQGLSDSDERFLERQAHEVMKRITDPFLSRLHVMVG